MKLLLFFSRVSSLVLSSSLLSLATEGSNNSDVLNLTSTNFKTTVESEDVVLVMFSDRTSTPIAAQYATEWESAASTLKGKGVKLARVACEEEELLCGNLGITYDGFLTYALYYYKNGVATRVRPFKLLKAADIVSYMAKEMLPPVTKLTNGRAFLEFIKHPQTAEIVTVAYLPRQYLPLEEAAPSFISVAKSYFYDARYAFGASSSPAVAAAAGVVAPAVVVYRPFDDRRVLYRPLTAGDTPSIAEVTEQDLKAWIDAVSLPILQEVTWENSTLWIEQLHRRPLAYVLVNPNQDPEGTKNVLDIIRPVAEEAKFLMNFVWMDAALLDANSKLVKRLGLTWNGAMRPVALVITGWSDDGRWIALAYNQSEEITPMGVRKLVWRYHSDEKPRPAVNSEVEVPVPAKIKEGFLTALFKIGSKVLYFVF